MKNYKNKDVINNITFELKSGEIVGLIGPNGVGKTTLLNLIAGISTIDSGEIRKTKNKIFFMQESTVLYKDLTGLQHLKFVAKLNKKTALDIDNVINELNMHSYISVKVKNYSLGMKQHLMFACGLICRPNIFLLDEPLNGLDPDSVIKFRDIIKKLKEEGTCILFSSHMLSEVDLISDRTFFLKKGKIEKTINNKNKVDEKIYKLNVSESSTSLIDCLKTHQIEILEYTAEKIVVIVSEANLDLVFKKIYENGVTVKSVNQETTLLEKHYKEVYGDSYE
ncbi:ABC transporter ATP-binding protein [Planococcus sp. SE5232]|uniref:ABC transporter ATP-binding protein n=1 Tax=Planococcus sp. SE5232 TaxID=3428617 RepID=UPI003D6A94A3